MTLLRINAALLLSMVALGCGGVCGDYETKANDCCDKIAAGDKTAAATCRATVARIVDADDANACQQALDEDVTANVLCK